MNDKQKTIYELAQKITKELSDQGKIIEGGWRGFELMMISEEAAEGQRHDMRTAFYAGAQHLYGSIMTVLDPGAEATDNDLRRLDLIDKELNRFYRELKERLN